MATDVPLRCKCGTIRGVARNCSAATGSHVVCYCADCATFAEVLDRSDVLNAHGGSDIFQTAPSWVQIAEGHAQLRCLRLSPKGTHRWYAGCCHTLIGNTLGPRSFFVGLLTELMVPADGRSIDDVLGPPIGHVNGQAAGRTVPPHVHPRLPLGTIFKTAGRLPRWLLAGTVHPFFAAAPANAMRVLTREERQTAREAAVRRADHAGTTSPSA